MRFCRSHYAVPLQTDSLGKVWASNATWGRHGIVLRSARSDLWIKSRVWILRTMLSTGNLELALDKSKLPRTARCVRGHDVRSPQADALLARLRLAHCKPAVIACRLAKANNTDNHRCRDKRWDQNTPCYHIVREGCKLLGWVKKQPD